MAPWKRFSKSKLSLVDESTSGNPNWPSPGHSRTPSVGGSDLLQALNSELQQTIQSQEDKINDQNQVIEIHQHTIEGLKEEKGLLQSQVWKFSDQLTQSRREVGALRTNGETLEGHLQTLRAQVQVSEGKINEQMQELETRSNTIQLLSRHNQRLQNRVADLETFVSAASRDTGTDFRAFFTHYSEVKSAHNEMASRLKSAEVVRLALDERLSEIQSENDSLKTVINELQKEASALEVCQPQTLRALLTLRLVEQTWNVQSDDGILEEPNQAQSCLL
jgi:chromosome segregation ATPase